MARQALLPLAHVRHARDEPLRSQQPGIVEVMVWVLAGGHRAVDMFVQEGRLADQRRTQQQHGPALGRTQQAGQLHEGAFAENNTVQIVGKEMIEISADPM